jgi:hypothetical protein
MDESRNPFEAPRTDSAPRPGSHRQLRWMWVRPVVLGMSLLLAVTSGLIMLRLGQLIGRNVGSASDPYEQERYNRLALFAGLFAGSTFVVFATGVSMVVRGNLRRKRLHPHQPTETEGFGYSIQPPPNTRGPS